MTDNLELLAKGTGIDWGHQYLHCVSSTTYFIVRAYVRKLYHCLYIKTYFESKHVFKGRICCKAQGILYILPIRTTLIIKL